MTRITGWVALLAGACAVVAGYRQASAASAVPEARLQRVCVAGVRIELPDEHGGPPPPSMETDPRALEDPCGLPAVPLGVPGERLATVRVAPEGGVIASRVRSAPGTALAGAIEGLRGQGWRETAGSKGARARVPSLPMASLARPGGALLAIATAAPSGDGSFVLVVALPEGEVAP
jgi:hypothetical protein